MENVNSILVIGSGIMGRGIAQVSAMGGFETVVQDVSEDALVKAKQIIDRNLAKGIEKGKVTSDERETAMKRLSFVTSFDQIADEVDAVIEAAPEKLALKQEIFKKLGERTKPSAMLATNTSALSVTKIAEACSRPSSVIGMHFFNPVHIMKLIEIVTGKETNEETLATAIEVGKRMRKETVIVKESPGFVTSRMNALIGNEAFRMLEAGIASAEDIDKALKLGLNHPMGPFEMADLVGLDTRLFILKYLHSTLGDLYKPSSLLEKYVQEGRLGKKSGRGVYEY